MVQHYSIILILPLILANLIHILIVKYKLLPSLQIPVSATLFGSNKTLRGFIVLTVLNAFFSSLAAIYMHLPNLLYYLLTGALYGFCYMLFELPNSWFKRRQGINPGQAAQTHTLLYALLDKSDSCFGVCLVFYFIAVPGIGIVIKLFFISVAIHIVLSALLYKLKIKKAF